MPRGFDDNHPDPEFWSNRKLMTELKQNVIPVVGTMYVTTRIYDTIFNRLVHKRSVMARGPYIKKEVTKSETDD